MVGAFERALGRKLPIRGGAALRSFLKVKLLSRFVTPRLAHDDGRVLAQGVWLQISLKGGADIAGKAVTLVITAVAARTLVADAFGVMALAMATGWLLGVATDAGLSMHLARETARRPASGRQLLIEVLRLRAGLAYVAATMIAFYTPRMVPPHWKMQFVLVVLAQLTAAMIETVAHYFRGVQRSEIESAIHAGYRFTTLILSLIVLMMWPRLDFLGAAMLIPAVIALLISVGMAWRLSAAGNREPGTGNLTPSRFFRDILPLGAGVLLSALYFRIDLYFIERWHGLEAVGGYNAVFRLVEAMRLLPAAVLAVTFPLLVQTTDTRLVQRLGGALALGGGVLAVICAMGATFFVPLVYGTPYLYAAPAFTILAFALPLFFLNYALTHQVIGWDGQRAYLMIAAVALAANIAANVALVPSQGINGAAIATLLTEVVVTAGCLAFLNLRAEPSCRTTVSNPRVEPSS
jgi:O-antigen/teichoic acid export membrane protein